METHEKAAIFKPSLKETDLRGNQTCLHFDFRPPASRTVCEKPNFCCVSHLVCGYFIMAVPYLTRNFQSFPATLSGSILPDQIFFFSSLFFLLNFRRILKIHNSLKITKYACSHQAELAAIKVFSCLFQGFLIK